MTVRLSDSIQRRLNAYALAASAAGVGVLAMSQPAEAKILYTRIHHVIKPKQQYNLDLNHDGTADFEFKNSSGSHRLTQYAIVALPFSTNGVEGGGSERTQYSRASAYALKRGALISSKRQLFVGDVMAAVTQLTRSKREYFGQWVNVNDRYLGLKFLIEGKMHYGWARLNVRVLGFLITATLTGYAYETIPNKPMIAGKTKGPDVITIHPGSATGTLGRLALGRK